MDAKWIFDRTASFLGLICLCPILLIIAILIKIKMPGGPVIFQQVRVGKEGKLFTMPYSTYTLQQNENEENP